MTLVLGLLIVGGLVAFATWSSTASSTAKARAAAKADADAQLVCPHCQESGAVTTVPVVRKVGVSGGKATGALFTGGASMLLTGLSRKQHMTRMLCTNCGTGWDVA